MRKPIEHRATDGTRTWKVRYRSGGKETSQTFRRKADAEMFAGIMGRGETDRIAEALAWLAAKDSDREAETFAQWFDAYVDQLTGVTPRTREDYRSLRRRYLSDLDSVPLPLLTRAHVTAIVNDMDRAGRAPKTIKQAIHLLSTCLQMAVDQRHLSANPCKGIRLPSQQLGGAEARFLTYEQAGALIEAMPAHYRPLVTFLFGTGMRWSEATAIMGKHVNLDKGTVRVEQAWKRVPGQGFEIGPPKTRKARRTVNAAVPALLAIEPLIRKPNDLLFLTASGGPVRHANFLTNVWPKACARAGLDPRPRIHDTRHSHASWLISDGQSLEAVQDQLGHESILTTRGTYGHLQPALGVAIGLAASQAMERVLSMDRAESARRLSIEA